jgi:hypothetical protein
MLNIKLSTFKEKRRYSAVVKRYATYTAGLGFDSHLVQKINFVMRGAQDRVHACCTMVFRPYHPISVRIVRGGPM